MCLRRFTGLGPPDHCRLSKIETRLSGTDRRNFHHSVLGIDTSGIDPIASYILSLFESSDAFNPLSGGQWKIDAGTYCTWDCFSRTDIRITVLIRASLTVSVHSVSSDGLTSEHVPAEVWEGCAISSFLRCIQDVAGSGSLNVAPNWPSEERIRHISHSFCKFVPVSDRTGIPNDRRHVSNTAIHSFCSMLLKRFRIKSGIELFSSLQSLYPPIVYYIAQAYRMRNQSDTALSVITRALRSTPEDECLLIQVGGILLKENEVETAISAIRLALEVNPCNPWGWIRYAESFLVRKDIRGTIEALNIALSEHQPAAEDYLLEDGLIQRTGAVEVTFPQDMHGIGCNRDVWNKPRIPGTIDLVPGTFEPLHFPGGLGLADWLDTKGSLSMIRSHSPRDTGEHASLFDWESDPVQRAAFRLLYRTYSDFGWDRLAEVRGGIFSSESRIGLPFDSREAFGARACSASLDKLFKQLRVDIFSIIAFKAEVNSQRKLGILPKLNPQQWVSRVRVCHYLDDPELLEIACRMALAQGFSPYVARRLVRLYVSRGKAKEAIATLYNLWQNMCRRLLHPDPHSVPWLLKFTSSAGFQNFHSFPAWVINLTLKVLERFGTYSVREVLFHLKPRISALEDLIGEVESDQYTDVKKHE